MIYTHPYSRGFSAWITQEGYLSLGVLIWKWEIHWNYHGIKPGIDHVITLHRRQIAERDAALAGAEASNLYLRADIKLLKAEVKALKPPAPPV